MSDIDELIYGLQKATDRLQRQAHGCRGTICDDYLAYGLQKEADACREAVRLLVRAKESAK